MKIYTRTGDKGNTSLYGGTKVPKNHIRIEAYGTVDELNSCIGLIRVKDIPPLVSQELLEIQNDLFSLGAELATPNEKWLLPNGKPRLENIIETQDIEKQESWIDNHTQHLPALTHFVLPGGEIANAHCHLARTVCRRAERIVVALSEFEEIRDECIVYLNRLSDYLFTLSRLMSHLAGKEEIKWEP